MCTQRYRDLNIYVQKRIQCFTVLKLLRADLTMKESSNRLRMSFKFHY